jgi:hypothetical protein
MQLVDVWHRLSNDGFAVVFTEFVRQILFFSRMEKGAYFRLVASEFVAAYAFVLVRVVKSLHSSVTLLTL